METLETLKDYPELPFAVITTFGILTWLFLMAVLAWNLHKKRRIANSGNPQGLSLREQQWLEFILFVEELDGPSLATFRYANQAFGDSLLFLSGIESCSFSSPLLLRSLLYRTCSRWADTQGRTKEYHSNPKALAALYSSFCAAVLVHIREYTLPRYGDSGSDPATAYTLQGVRDCISKYLMRKPNKQRGDESTLDQIKTAHYLCIGWCVAKQKEEKDAKNQPN